MTDTPHPEFSRIIDIRHLDAKPITLIASAEEARALAKRFDLVAVHRLAASVTITADDTSFRVTGRLTADIVQSCAISGEDLPVIIDEPLNLRFVPASEMVAEPSDEEIEITEEDCDEIEFSGERFDLGEAVAQSLGLAIDPFAEGPEAERVRREVGLADEGASGPFAALAALKKQ